MILPDLSQAASDPGISAGLISALVRSSLQEEWRAEHGTDDVLERLADYLEMYLAALGDPARLSSEKSGPPAEAEVESACTACLKLARNFCVGCPAVQERWWHRGLVIRVGARARADWAAPLERSAAWREAVTSFLANSIAGSTELRGFVLEAFFPHHLVAAAALCWHRPDYTFLLMQNLFPQGSGSASADGVAESIRLLVDSADGHCVLLVLFSVLNRMEDHVTGDAAQEKARNWAAVFFNSLWISGGFVPAYRGIKALEASQVHDFICQTAAWAGSALDAEPKSPDLTRMSNRLCGKVEALALCWHTVQRLVSGEQSGPAGTQQALSELLSRDAAFDRLLAEEMSESLAGLASNCDLPWPPRLPPEEALAALGIQGVELEVFSAGLGPADAGPHPVGHVSGFHSELIGAAVILSSLRPTASPGDVSGHPVRFLAVVLVGCVGLLDALHLLRFGDPSTGIVIEKPTAESVAASHACRLLDQVRLCGNALYERPQAQNFLVLSGGLRVLLSHCYADSEFPLLREAGVFAVRNATHHNLAAQEAAEALLKDQRAARSGPAVPDLGECLGFRGG